MSGPASNGGRVGNRTCAGSMLTCHERQPNQIHAAKCSVPAIVAPRAAGHEPIGHSANAETPAATRVLTTTMNIAELANTWLTLRRFAPIV